jgi:hypothetical protein
MFMTLMNALNHNNITQTYYQTKHKNISNNYYNASEYFGNTHDKFVT